jgi:hypothetical protein
MADDHDENAGKKATDKDAAKAANAVESVTNYVEDVEIDAEKAKASLSGLAETPASAVET